MCILLYNAFSPVYFPSASSFNSAALDKAARPAKASPRFTLRHHAADASASCCETELESSDGIMLDEAVDDVDFNDNGDVFTDFMLELMLRRDRLCKMEDGDANSFMSGTTFCASDRLN